MEAKFFLPNHISLFISWSQNAVIWIKLFQIVKLDIFAFFLQIISKHFFRIYKEITFLAISDLFPLLLANYRLTGSFFSIFSLISWHFWIFWHYIQLFWPISILMPMLWMDIWIFPHYFSCLYPFSTCFWNISRFYLRESPAWIIHPLPEIFR